MRLVVLTGDGPEHRYVTGRLADAFPDELRAIVLSEPAPQSLSARLRGYRRRYTISQISSRILARLYSRWTGKARRRDETVTRVLFPRGDDKRMPRPDLVRVVPGHNSAESLSLLRSLEPDVIAVYGTAMIRPPVIALARNAILNMHTGLSPFYRGSDTIFWALHDERLDRIGVTVHLLDPGIDSGAIISATRLSIDPSDNEDSLFAKAVAVGAERYVEAIRMAASGNLRALPQSLEVGREYRFVDRTVAAERRVDRLVAGGICRRFADSSLAASDPS